VIISPAKITSGGRTRRFHHKKNTVTNRKICDIMEKRRAGMLIKICCPVCGKRLFDADVSASGMISAYCKRCKVERLIELKGKT
jgi:hypothetical protein